MFKLYIRFSFIKTSKNWAIMKEFDGHVFINLRVFASKVEQRLTRLHRSRLYKQLLAPYMVKEAELYPLNYS